MEELGENARRPAVMRGQKRGQGGLEQRADVEVLSAPDGRSPPFRSYRGSVASWPHRHAPACILARTWPNALWEFGQPGRRRWRDAGVQVAGDAGVTALWRRGRRTVTSRPPVETAVACTVPLWTVAMDDTRARPRPKPSWRVRSSSRVNGRNSRSTWSGGTTRPVLTTRTTDAPLSVVVEIVTVPPAML